jgi:hypothetical protein
MTREEKRKKQESDGVLHTHIKHNSLALLLFRNDENGERERERENSPRDTSLTTLCRCSLRLFFSSFREREREREREDAREKDLVKNFPEPIISVP